MATWKPYYHGFWELLGFPITQDIVSTYPRYNMFHGNQKLTTRHAASTQSALSHCATCLFRCFNRFQAAHLAAYVLIPLSILCAIDKKLMEETFMLIAEVELDFLLSFTLGLLS